jgi:hypothetical protein
MLTAALGVWYADGIGLYAEGFVSSANAFIPVVRGAYSRRGVRIDVGKDDLA